MAGLDFASLLRSDALRLEYKKYQKRLLKLTFFGIIGLVLGPFGESCLSRSSPIFEKIGFSYGTWQIGYTIGLFLFALIWLIAMVRLLGEMSDCKQRRERAIRLELAEEVKAVARAERILEAKRQEEEQAELIIRNRRPPPSLPQRDVKKKSKFDY